MVCGGLEPGAAEGADESTELWQHPIIIVCLGPLNRVTMNDLFVV